MHWTSVLLILIVNILPVQTVAGQSIKSSKSSPIFLNIDSLLSQRGPNIQNKGSIFGNISPDSSEYHILIICVQNYNDKEWMTLKWPLYDANRLKEVLLKRYSFKEINVSVLVNPSRAQMF
jgi:hypothetical protein